MAFITVSGETGCRTEELARAIAHRLDFELVSETRIEALIAAEFAAAIPPKAWAAAVTSILARLGTQHNLVIAASGSEHLLPKVAGVLRIYLMAREACRSGTVMLDRGTDRAGAIALLREIDLQERRKRKSRFLRSSPVLNLFDLVLNAETFEVECLAAVVEAAALARRLPEYGRLSAAAEAQLEFQARLQLARHGIAPPAKGDLTPKTFSHPSEQLFANLLDFYRIAWAYEPHSFPLQWDKGGKVTEAFTPDFYLPEFELYIELTTMKQALVTKKNRKIKLLKAIYPHINIQVFYQKDFQNLIFKYGLEGREVSTNAD